MSNQEGEVIRKIKPRKHERLSEPRILPLEGEELNNVRGKERNIVIATIDDESDLAKLRQMLAEGQEKNAPFLGENSTLNVIKTFARHRDFYLRYFTLNIHTRFLSTLPPRDKEILILRIGWLCYSSYEWYQHAGGAKLDELLSEDEINHIIEGPDAVGWDPFEATLLRAVDELYTDAFIRDETWNTLAERYTTHQLMDLVFTVGDYNMIAMALNTFGVQLEEGLKPLIENLKIPKMK